MAKVSIDIDLPGVVTQTLNVNRAKVILRLFTVKSDRKIVRDAMADHLKSKAISSCSFRYQVLPLRDDERHYPFHCDNYFLCLPTAKEGQGSQSDQEAGIALG